jgi:hypothetical protein
MRIVRISKPHKQFGVKREWSCVLRPDPDGNNGCACGTACYMLVFQQVLKKYFPEYDVEMPEETQRRIVKWVDEAIALANIEAYTELREVFFRFVGQHLNAKRKHLQLPPIP